MDSHVLAGREKRKAPAGAGASLLSGKAVYFE